MNAEEAVGVVAIGRNEGQRLRRCLESVLAQTPLAVYVDSGSTDGSVEVARELGAAVVELDADRPFTAARARNAGLRHLSSAQVIPEFVQVIDGDCELVDGWLASAGRIMQDGPRVAVVCGRRRERRREATIYNRLCDMEWDTPIGQVRSCGGDALLRLAAVEEVDGYREDLIAGEEPELCVRLRRQGWTVHRIDEEMTRHDAAMTRFGQWWRRAVRSGYASAEGRALHGRSPERHAVREVRSILLWTLVVPLAAIGLAIPTFGLGLLAGVAAYALLWTRVRRHRRRHGDRSGDASLYASFCVLGKFAELQGVWRCWSGRWRGRPAGLIEYKGVVQACPGPAARPLSRETGRDPDDGSPGTDRAGADERSDG
jgi:glycosyltransferase involved in cell wall biosynthesis